MKRLDLIILSLLVLLSVGCGWKGIRGNGKIKTEARPVTAFTRVDAGGFYELEWHPGAPSLSLTTDENLLAHIETRMAGDVLKIEMHGTFSPTRGIKIAIISPALTGASLSGAVKFDATQISAATFALETSGATRVTLAGKVSRLLASLTGASKLKAADLPAEEVELSVTGAGKADVTVSNLLRVSITGAGKVTYGGQPKSVEKRITGAGKIAPRE